MDGERRPRDTSRRTYSEEFEFLFETSHRDLDDYLRGHALDMKLAVYGSRFRSVCWRIFLDVLPEDRVEWAQALLKRRQEYAEKLREFDYNPRDIGALEDNPLSQDDKSKWNKFFLDEELKQMIHQDVVRTWPEVEVFHLPYVRSMMTSILFYYSRCKPSLSYRQGMHEILAPIIYVLYSDQRAYKEALKNGEIARLGDGNRRILADLLNAEYTAHDAYAMFCSLMETLESWYCCPDNGDNSRQQELTQQPFAKNSVEVHTVLGLKLCKISQHILKRLDPPLQQHLEALEINPQVYGIRWLRLLFSREYPLHCVLSLWDTIFADSISLDLADYIFASMLIAIRDRLLAVDYSDCLGLLMRYPDDIEVSYVIKLALHFRDHYKYPRPTQRQPSQERPLSPRRPRANRPQTLEFCSPESDEAPDWQNMLSTGGSVVVERELSLSSTSQELGLLRCRIAECTHSMDIHLASLQQCLVGGKVPGEEALVALAQLKSVRDQLKESIGVDEMEEGGWTVVTTSACADQPHTNGMGILNKKLNGLIRRE